MKYTFLIYSPADGLNLILILGYYEPSCYEQSLACLLGGYILPFLLSIY